MAPRTPEQQKAYNEKRRAENAALKAKPAKVKPAPKVFARKTGKITKAEVRAILKKSTIKPKPLVGEPMKALAAALADEAKVRKPIKKAIQKIVAQPTPAPAQVDKSQLTNARSYQKKFSGMGATMRGTMAQVTVTFTVEQFNTLKSAAEFRGCSIAEAIRQAVLREHGSALNP